MGKWKQDIPKLSRLVNYKNFKLSFCTEHYVKTALNRRIRSLICKLRCGTLPIQVELGRYRSVPRDERLCQYCNTREVEDEFHLLFKCPLYKEERAKFFKSINVNAANVTLNELLCDNVILKTGQYISNLMSIRARTV